MNEVPSHPGWALAFGSSPAPSCLRCWAGGMEGLLCPGSGGPEDWRSRTPKPSPCWGWGDQEGSQLPASRHGPPSGPLLLFLPPCRNQNIPVQRQRWGYFGRGGGKANASLCSKTCGV